MKLRKCAFIKNETIKNETIKNEHVIDIHSHFTPQMNYYVVKYLYEAQKIIQIINVIFENHTLPRLTTQSYMK